MKKIEMPANYRVLKDEKVVAAFVHSEHVLAFIQNAGCSIEHFKVQFMSEPDASGVPQVVRDLRIRTKLVLV